MFTENLKLLRNSQKITHEEIAKYLGVAQQVYSNWENKKNPINSQKNTPDEVKKGEVKIKPSDLYSLAIKLNVSADYLIGSLSYKQRIKELREEKGLTQEELAIDLKLSKEEIEGYEWVNPNSPEPLEQEKPSHRTLESLAKYFNVSMDYLNGRTDNRNSDRYVNHDLPHEVNVAINLYIDYVKSKYHK